MGSPLTFATSRSIACNRFLKAALTERIATWNPKNEHSNGIPTERIYNLYEKWGNGGFGMILTGNVMIDRHHLESAGNMIIAKEIDSTERRQAFKRLASKMKSDGALAIVQLGHAGRQTPITINAQPFSASDIQLKVIRQATGFGVPTALSTEQIKTEVIDRFVYAARYCQEAGFDGVQVHAAHGYLISQFMSPSTNKRIDKYGGSPANRARIVLEIYDAIRQAVTDDFIVGVKMNSVEFQKDGLQADDAVKICELMDTAGFDFIELSGGTMELFAFAHMRESTKKKEAFFLDFADEIIKRIRKSIIYVTGGFRTAQGMANAIKNGSTHGVGLGRPITQEPDLPKKILSALSTRAKQSLLDEHDLVLTSMASNTQMAQAGMAPLRIDPCENIMDLGDEKTVAEYKAAVKKYTQQIAEKARKGEPIYGVIDRFAYAARYCQEAGFDGVQVHAAHGYLISQFMSPTTNKRIDKYGGSPANRARIVLEIYDAIRQAVTNDFIVGVKMNSVEFQKDGLQANDAVKICELMDTAGFDFIELSGGTMELFAFAHMRESTKKREAFFLDFADEIIKRIRKSIIYVTGGFRTAQGMANAIKNGSTHGVGLGRPITQEPDLPKKIISALSTRAKQSLLDEHDFALTNMASNTQMAQAGMAPLRIDPCENIMDLSDEKTVAEYKAAVKKYTQQIAEKARKGEPIYGVLEYGCNNE
ncbi:unnamed protein product [Toxocara canis]|uniref:NADH:flavin oxidoreductase/NADH oxidase N-terminal domain-containing protein n=1 Tax=Toxocara canis TaxID=6265 RepID=A0A3P7GRA7_TOXCA|nr:unnamed protein product [Toxocara canis]